MKEIVKVDAISLAKVIGLIWGGIYLIVGILVNLAVLVFGLGAISGLDFLGFGSGIIATILVSIIIGLAAFIIGLIGGFIYNFVANYFGGVIVLFEDRTIVEERLRESKAAKIALKEEKKRLKEERKRLKAEQKKKEYEAKQKQKQEKSSEEKEPTKEEVSSEPAKSDEENSDIPTP